MKLKKDCCMHTVAGENIIIRSGATETDLTNVVVFNPTAAWLWRQMEGKEFAAGEVPALLEAHYEVNADTAVADAAAWLKALEQNNLLVP